MPAGAITGKQGISKPHRRATCRAFTRKKMAWALVPTGNRLATPAWRERIKNPRRPVGGKAVRRAAFFRRPGPEGPKPLPARDFLIPPCQSGGRNLGDHHYGMIPVILANDSGCASWWRRPWPSDGGCPQDCCSQARGDVLEGDCRRTRCWCEGTSAAPPRSAPRTLLQGSP